MQINVRCPMQRTVQCDSSSWSLEFDEASARRMKARHPLYVDRLWILKTFERHPYSAV
jgi:hypothetical protein